MKKLTFLLLAATIAGGAAQAQDAVTMQTCEYWFDYDFEHRTSVAMNGNEVFSQQFDLSDLPQGVHSIGLRFGDSKGLWCAPFVKHFVIPTLPPNSYPDNKIAKIEYWYDYDFEHRQTFESSNGNVAINLDVSDMAKGIHSISYRALDNRGLYTAPFVKHFVVPDFTVLPTITGIAAYEYWFNHGPRVRVEVNTEKTLDLQNQVIEVKDIVPNAITEAYQFDAKEGVVYVPDNVTFGIQAFDDAGHPSTAVLSETFAYTVPVPLQMIPLRVNEPEDVEAPSQGSFRSFKMEAMQGDSILFRTNANGHLDFYDENGVPLEVTAEQDKQTGYTSYKAIASTPSIYALLWGVPVAVNTVEVAYTSYNATDVKNVQTDGIQIRSEKGRLSVTLPTSGTLSVLSVNGTAIINRLCEHGTHTFSLPSGVYLICFNQHNTVKAIVR